jgi:hypothetical protein
MPPDFLMIPVTILALITSALSGVIESRRSNMDLVGALAVAFFTALGGGTIRDMMLGNLPVFWLTDDYYALIVFGSAHGRGDRRVRGDLARHGVQPDSGRVLEGAGTICHGLLCRRLRVSPADQGRHRPDHDFHLRVSPDCDHPAAVGPV